MALPYYGHLTMASELLCSQEALALVLALLLVKRKFLNSGTASIYFLPQYLQPWWHSEHPGHNALEYLISIYHMLLGEGCGEHLF